MPDLNFSQPERSRLLVPILIAMAVMLLIGGLVLAFLPHRTAEIAVTHVAVLPTHTSLTTGSRVVGSTTEIEDNLYVLATVRIKDNLSMPLFIKDLTGSMTSADDADQTSSAVEKDDLNAVYTAFPALKPMSGPPLLREIRIPPGGSAEGMVLLQFKATDADWKQRKAASITIAFYHQDPMTVEIPKP
ncbi:MAG TPA: hypothetical protein VG714_02480 [Acidobacteriaceae bacterium]|nr:hypothetical protein [Acidobacteriaceae bacterium]